MASNHEIDAALPAFPGAIVARGLGMDSEAAFDRTPCFACEALGVAPADGRGSVRVDPATGAWWCPWCDASGSRETYIALGELTRRAELAVAPWLAADQGGERLGLIRDAALELLRRDVPMRLVSRLALAVDQARTWPWGGPMGREILAMPLVWAAELAGKACRRRAA